MELLWLAVLGLYAYEGGLFVATYRRERVVGISRPETLFLGICLLVYVLPLVLRRELYTVYGQVVVAGILSFCVGAKYVDGLHFAMHELRINKRALSYSPPWRPGRNRYGILLVLGIGLYLLFFSWKGVPAFAGNFNVARIELGRGAGFLTFPAAILLTAATGIAFAGVLNKRNGLRARVPFAAMFVLSCTLMFLTGWRGPVAHLIGIMLVVASLVGRLKARHLLWGVLGALLVGFLGILRGILSERSLYDNQIPVLEIQSPAEYLYYSGLYLVFRIYEHYYNFQVVVDAFDMGTFLAGKGLLMDLPGGAPSLDYYIRTNYKVNDWVGGAGMPPTLFGSLYVEYGVPAVVLGSFLSGAVFKAFYRALNVARLKWVIIYASACVWLIKSVFGQIGLSLIVYNGVYAVGLYGCFLVWTSYERVRRVMFSGAAEKRLRLGLSTEGRL